MRFGVVGCGHVGLMTALTLLELGHSVVGIEINTDKLKRLNMGEMPHYEPNTLLPLRTGLNSGKLSFSNDYSFLSHCDAVFICVNAPLDEDFRLDHAFLAEAAGMCVKFTKSDTLLVIRSTVEPGTTSKIYDYLKREVSFGTIRLVYLPEFFREGTAFDDSVKPDRVVVGCRSVEDADFITDLYKPNCDSFVVTNWESAELAKMASNAFIANKISFINSMARLAGRVGANIDDVSTAMGLDHRIGKGCLKAGIGWGGNCLPKDTAALNTYMEDLGEDNCMVNSLIQINDSMVAHLVNKIERALGGLKNKEIAVLGLTFKPNTDDIGHSKSLELVQLLSIKGAFVKVYDPVRNDKLAGLKAEQKPSMEKAVEYAQAVVVATDWNEFLNCNWEEIKEWMGGDLIVDARNCLNRWDVEKANLRYIGVGY